MYCVITVFHLLPTEWLFSFTRELGTKRVFPSELRNYYDSFDLRSSRASRWLIARDLHTRRRFAKRDRIMFAHHLAAANYSRGTDRWYVSSSKVGDA